MLTTDQQTETVLDGHTSGQLTDEGLAGVRKILDYPLDNVRNRIIKDGQMPTEQLDEAIAEFRKFLILVGLGHRNLGMTSKTVDEVWHNFILFTSDYASFCDEVFGGFIHHQPNTPSTPVPEDAGTNLYLAYTATFGKVPSKIWGFEADCSGSTACQEPTDPGGCCPGNCTGQNGGPRKPWSTKPITIN